MICAAQAVLGHHALDRVEDQLDGVLVEERLPGRRAQTARVARVVVGELLGGLVGGEDHLVGVDDDDVVAAVDVRGEVDAVLATQQRGGDRGDATEDQALGVDHEPVAGDLTGFWRKCAHRTSHKQLLTDRTGSEGLLSLGKIRLRGKSRGLFSPFDQREPSYFSSILARQRTGSGVSGGATWTTSNPGRRERPFRGPRGAGPRRSLERSATSTRSGPRRSRHGSGPLVRRG